MAIRIKNIQVRNLGPIADSEYDLGLVNLFYGQNESGKTFLTEFILSTLFSHAKKWQLRKIDPSGSVTVAGLKPDPVLFSPSSSRKIEDHWTAIQPGLPTNMSRVLVVKGADVSLAKAAPGGVGREVLKNALTSHQVLDSIRKAIPATAQNAELKGSLIFGKNQGLIKDKINLEQSLSDINKLLSVIENDFKGGALKELELQKNSIQDELTRQEYAKQHQAYLLWNKQQNLLAEREKLSDQALSSLRDQIRDFRKVNAELTKLNTRIKEIAPSVDTYNWLSKAISIWEKHELERYLMPSLVSLVIGGFLTLTGMGLLIAQYYLSRLELFWPGIAGILIGIGICAIYGYKYYQWSRVPAKSEERVTIQTSFFDRFGQELKGLTDLHHLRSQVEKEFHQESLLKEELSILTTELIPAREKITKLFSDIFDSSDHPLSEEVWLRRLEELFAQAKALDQESKDLLIEFTKLDIPQNKFLTSPTGTVFDPDKITELSKSLEDLNRMITDQERTLETLKIKACTFTQDDISAPWSDVLVNLRSQKEKISANHKKIIAELTAMIGLTSILNTLDKEEDQKIVQTINAVSVSELLHKLTGRYQKINLEGDQLMISDGKREYALQDLSTGARDQVLLALRLGMASHISGGRPLFLILDDAFQHADWERRRALVEEIGAIAEQGWQILYLTMDDHIRDLFQEIMMPRFKKEFRFIEMT